MTFQEKVDLIGKYKDKNDKFASVYKYGKNIDSPKLNDEQKEKVRKNVEVAYNAIKQMQDKKPTKTATAKGGAKKKTMLGLASEIKKRDNVSWDEAKKRAKRDYESEKKKLEKEEKQQLADFKKQVGKIKFVRATTKTDINKDKVIPALPSGKRYPKRGKTTNQWGTFNNNPKKPYWENRANRMDVNQPSKSVYPKLADGGEVNVFDNIFADYGFTKKRGAYGIKVFFNKDKNIYAQYDMKARELSVDDKDLRFSIRDLIEHLKSLGLTGKKYAKGGKFNDNLYIDQLANMSGARAVTVKEFASANNLSKDDLLNIIQGLGRKQITASQFVNAVLGDKTSTSEVVSYAKEGKGFKMAQGGISDSNKRFVLEVRDGKTDELLEERVYRYNRYKDALQDAKDDEEEFIKKYGDPLHFELKEKYAQGGEVEEMALSKSRLEFAEYNLSELEKEGKTSSNSSQYREWERFKKQYENKIKRLEQTLSPTFPKIKMENISDEDLKKKHTRALWNVNELRLGNLKPSKVIKTGRVTKEKADQFLMDIAKQYEIEMKKRGMPVYAQGGTAKRIKRMGC